MDPANKKWRPTLDKKIRRECYTTHRGRRIIIEIRPPDLIIFRLKKTRQEYPLTVQTAFEYACKLFAFAEVDRQKKARALKNQIKYGYGAGRNNHG
mgnify:CR=1 FL=1